MAPKKVENTERINVFFSKDDLDRIKAEATSRGMTVSGYIRYVCLEALNGQKYRLPYGFSQCKKCGYTLRMGEMFCPVCGQRSAE